ncbi:MAG TPA: 4-alpha-glucanotransferase [Balneolales bacterium]|nr:4-alpha-glucanotransferase [Balneolales bacterium]
MKFKRSSGTLVHPTSFPTPYGMGDLGPSANTFIDFLEETYQSVWQILPLTPTGYGNSPYASYSAFAGNHYLISPDLLVDKGLLSTAEVKDSIIDQTCKVDYERAFQVKDKLLALASDRFYENATLKELENFETFKTDNDYWIHDYALFMACLEHFDKKPWNKWETGLTRRHKRSLDKYRKMLKERIDYHYWLQYEFFDEWFALRSYANRKGIMIIGDIPIFVDHNSADVWSHSEYYEVDDEGNRVLVSGVPPDYFSETGQLWGNPLYKWKKLEKNGFDWWLKRFEQMFNLFDAIRVDHFRGFEAYWQVEATEETAINGRWVKGPGYKLFDTIKKELGELPIIAEDLGVLTEEVNLLRDNYNFPGMKILQFAFSDNEANSFLPHNYVNNNCVVYTGTHDNDTTLGWYNSATDLEKHRAREYTRSDGSNINWELIRVGMFSVARMAIFPLQDYMNLESDHRMNYPGTSTGNWDWRYTQDMLDNIDREHIRFLIKLSNRDGKSGAKDANLVSIETEEVS